MSETDEELEALAIEIVEGRDSIEIPVELTVETDKRKPMVLEKNIQQRILEMNVGEKLKLALKGHRDARTILIRDGTFIVKRFVLLNPRISDDEIVAVARNRHVDRELIELIVKRKEWLGNYQIKLAVVTNPKTPVVIALKHLRSLMTRDIRHLAKSKNIPAAVNSAAKRLIIS
jgi:hypothetical protein